MLELNFKSDLQYSYLQYSDLKYSNNAIFLLSDLHFTINIPAPAFTLCQSSWKELLCNFPLTRIIDRHLYFFGVFLIFVFVFLCYTFYFHVYFVYFILCFVFFILYSVFSILSELLCNLTLMGVTHILCHETDRETRKWLPPKFHHLMIKSSSNIIQGVLSLVLPLKIVSTYKKVNLGKVRCI